jgi:enterochelin esterase family protein
MVTVFVDSLSVEERMRELVYHDPFNDFLIQELMPWIQNLYHVTTDPIRIALGGSSVGGLAAVYVALEHSDVFGNVLSQSGAFRLVPAGEEGFGWLASQFVEKEKLPLRFHLDVGLLDENSLRDIGDGPNLLQSNREFRDALQNRAYDVHYTEFNGGHDYISW